MDTADELLTKTLDRMSGLDGQSKIDFLSSMLLLSIAYLENTLGEAWLDEFIVSARDDRTFIDFVSSRH